MKPEDVTNEMIDAAQIVVDQATWFSDPLHVKRAAIAAAINAMPMSDAKVQIDAAQEELRLCQQDAIKLQDECVALKAELQQRALEVMSLNAQNIDLATQRDALRKDAERYRWLRERLRITNFLDSALPRVHPPKVFKIQSEQLDAAIDAALAMEGEK